MKSRDGSESLSMVQRRDRRARGLNQPKCRGLTTASSWFPIAEGDPALLEQVDHRVGIRPIADVVSQADDGVDVGPVDVL